jgi:hypothetical protein
MPIEEPCGINVTLCGAPATGKTTFLAALHLALLQSGTGWRVSGLDQASNVGLIRLTETLIVDQAFPAATAQIEEYSWALTGLMQRDRSSRRRFGSQSRQDEPFIIRLYLADTPSPLAHAKLRRELINKVAQSDAIMYFFDPTREVEIGDAFQDVFNMLPSVAHIVGNRLPHYVAFCITKCDDVRVLKTAQMLGRLICHGSGGPRVPDEEAQDFFHSLSSVSPNGNADLLQSLFKQHFRPERVKYFVTSAIGFHLDPATGSYDPADSQNYLPRPEGAAIRGVPQPLNVAEPFLWLASNCRNLKERPVPPGPPI